MKQIKCEMCGSTELLKQEGIFVCQTCGTKYTVEEAKKMMVEVEGAITVKNSAQLENLMKLAQSSYDSKNYEQTEEFCNQIIAMDDQNYDAWRLKGQAIFFQINESSSRILEVYNCIMTSYRVLNNEQKAQKKLEIMMSLVFFLESEVGFWVDLFETNRPSKASLARIKEAYIGAYNKLKKALEEFEIEEGKEELLMSFDNSFIKRCVGVCESAWKTTVGYNYYRNDFDNLGKSWGVGNGWSAMVTTNTNSYRPTKDIAQTFLDETGLLNQLLNYAYEQFNEETPYVLKKNLFEHIIYFNERMLGIEAYEIGTEGYSVGWRHLFSLRDIADLSFLRENIALIKKELEKAKKYEVVKETLKEEVQKKKNEEYWKEHREKKEQLEGDKSNILKNISAIKSDIEAIENKYDKDVKNLEIEKDKKLSSELDVEKQKNVIRDLENQRSNCGLFKRKERKAITERIQTVEQPKYEELKRKADKEKKAHVDNINNQISAINKKIKEETRGLTEEMGNLQKMVNEITEELEKDR